MRFGGQELVIILVIVLVLFGATRLPALARSIGQSAKEFRKGLEDGNEETTVEAETKDAD
ncbi:MAG: twin-arginine translocase TatA/TatE family subunit [Acidimicrobiia bacterium]